MTPVLLHCWRIAWDLLKVGNLKEAIINISSNDFKILLSHDPSHWESQVLPHPYNFNLTLVATHTVFNFTEIPGVLKWSPAKWRYKQWAGIYKEKGQVINVNRGLGFLGYPGRVGIFPEISVITLKKHKQSLKKTKLEDIEH